MKTNTYRIFITDSEDIELFNDEIEAINENEALSKVLEFFQFSVGDMIQINRF